MGRAARGEAGSGDQIEFLTPRESLFGGDSAGEFTGFDLDDLPPPDDDEPRSRWLTGAAFVSVLALVAVGVIAAEPWSGDTAVAPPPTTVPPPETNPTTTAPAAVLPSGGLPSGAKQPGYVFDPLPAGYAITGARSDNSDSVDEPGGWSEVWASPEATSNSGQWFSIALTNDGRPFATDSTRIELTGRIGLLSQPAEGTLRLSALASATNPMQQLTVTSFGMSRDRLITLFEAIRLDDGSDVTSNRPHFLDPGLLDGFEQLASQPSQIDLIDAYLGQSGGSVPGHTSTSYATSSGESTIEVETSPRDDTLESLGRLAIGPIRIFPDTTSVPSTFTGQDLVLGVSPSNSEPEVVARWHDGQNTVVVRTTIPLSNLLSMLPTLRQTTPDEWTVARRRVAAQIPSDGLGPSQPATPIGGGTLVDGSTWTSSWRTPDWLEVQTPDWTTDQKMTSIHVARLDIWSTPAFTLITAATPPSPVPAVLRVLVRHQVLLEMPLVDIATLDPSSSVIGRVAVAVIEHVGPYEVEIIDANETVISHFLSPGSPA